MKTKELLEKDAGQLNAELAEKQKHLFTLRTQAVTEKLEDPSQLGKARKEIARIKTVLNQRKQQQAKRSLPAKQSAAAKQPAAAAASTETK